MNEREKKNETNNKVESYPRHSDINETPTYFLKTPTDLF